MRRKWRLGMQPITHRRQKIKLQWPLDLSLRGAFRRLEDLTIITVSTRKEKSVFEQSLDFLGIEGCVVLSGLFEGDWRHVLKIKWILEYLSSGKCKTPYVLYCDAFDAIMRDDPQKVLDTFRRLGNKIIFGSTMSRRGIFNVVPDLFEWTQTVARKSGRYLNAGVFIGEVDFTKFIFSEASKLIGKFHRTDYSDQDIFRYLHRIFYPDVDIDYLNEIVYRN